MKSLLLAHRKPFNHARVRLQRSLKRTSIDPIRRGYPLIFRVARYGSIGLNYSRLRDLVIICSNALHYRVGSASSKENGIKLCTARIRPIKVKRSKGNALHIQLDSKPWALDFSFHVPRSVLSDCA